MQIVAELISSVTRLSSKCLSIGSHFFSYYYFIQLYVHSREVFAIGGAVPFRIRIVMYIFIKSTKKNSSEVNFSKRATGNSNLQPLSPQHDAFNHSATMHTSSSILTASYLYAIFTVGGTHTSRRCLGVAEACSLSPVTWHKGPKGVLRASPLPSCRCGAACLPFRTSTYGVWSPVLVSLSPSSHCLR